MEKVLFEEMTLNETQQVDGGFFPIVLMIAAAAGVPAAVKLYDMLMK